MVMKINSFVPSGVNAQNNSPQIERQVQQRNAVDTQLTVKGTSNEMRTDAEMEDAVNGDMLDNAVEQANKTLKVYNKYIERSVHEKTHTIMYVLRDEETKEIIREFPPRKIQDMIAKMWELAGLLVDERR
jgi:flagellar protein FlaG